MRSFSLGLLALVALVGFAWATSIPLTGVGMNGFVTPGACDGTIDLSTGCVQPMLGVL